MHGSSFAYIRRILSPLDQFEIHSLISLNLPVLGIHIYIYNLIFYLMIGGLIIYIYSTLTINNNKLISNNWSIGPESTYATILSIVRNQINSKSGLGFLPFIYALFIFILIHNLIGMVPYSFALTSHFILTFFVSFSIVLGSTLLGWNKFGYLFLSQLVPEGCPLALLPLLVLIEFISYLARNISLGLRLAANILSGHMLLIILAGFTYKIMNAGLLAFFIGVIPMSFIIAFSALELGIAFIQAQVFVVLSSSYIKDGLELH